MEKYDLFRVPQNLFEKHRKCSKIVRCNVLNVNVIHESLAAHRHNNQEVSFSCYHYNICVNINIFCLLTFQFLKDFTITYVFFSRVFCSFPQKKTSTVKGQNALGFLSMIYILLSCCVVLRIFNGCILMHMYQPYIPSSCFITNKCLFDVTFFSKYIYIFSVFCTLLLQIKTPRGTFSIHEPSYFKLDTLKYIQH